MEHGHFPTSKALSTIEGLEKIFFRGEARNFAELRPAAFQMVFLE